MNKIDRYAVNISSNPTISEAVVIDRAKEGALPHSFKVLARCDEVIVANRIALLLNRSEE